MSLKDRYGPAALITGASSGFGEAFARRLAAEGFDVALVARREDRLRALAAELVGVKAVVIADDLGRPGAGADVARRARDAGLEIGLLVSNAGFGQHGAFASLDAARDAAMVDLNCRAPVELAHAVLPDMLARRRGGLIFLASVAAYQPCPFYATYGATKTFNLMLAEALWAELRGAGVDALAVSPPYVETGFQAAAGVKLDRPWPKPFVGTPKAVVDGALAALGCKPSCVIGAPSKLLAWSVRLAPRSWVAKMSGEMSRPGSDPVS